MAHSHNFSRSCARKNNASSFATEILLLQRLFQYPKAFLSSLNGKE